MYLSMSACLYVSTCRYITFKRICCNLLIIFQCRARNRRIYIHMCIYTYVCNVALNHVATTTFYSSTRFRINSTLLCVNLRGRHIECATLTNVAYQNALILPSLFFDFVTFALFHIQHWYFTIKSIAKLCQFAVDFQ